MGMMQNPRQMMMQNPRQMAGRTMVPCRMGPKGGRMGMRGTVGRQVPYDDIGMSSNVTNVGMMNGMMMQRQPMMFQQTRQPMMQVQRQPMMVQRGVYPRQTVSQ